MTGNQACQQAFAHTIAPYQTGTALVDMQIKVCEQRTAVGQVIRNAFQRYTSNESHTHSRDAQIYPLLQGSQELAASIAAASMAHWTNTSVEGG